MLSVLIEMYSNIFTDVEIEDRRLKKWKQESKVLQKSPVKPSKILKSIKSTLKTTDFDKILKSTDNVIRYLQGFKLVGSGWSTPTPQERDRPLPERERDYPSRYNEPQEEYYWDYYGYRGPYGY